MSVKWVIGVVTLWGLLAVLGGVCELGYYAEESALYSMYTAFDFTEAEGVLGHIEAFISGGIDLVEGLWTLLTFSSPIFDGELQIIRYLFFIPISIGVGWGLLSTLRGAPSG